MVAQVATESRALAVIDTWNERQIALIKQHIAPGIPNDELEYFAAQCRRTRLDPFLKQIYCIPRGTGDKRTWTVQTGIDGYRLIAARSGTFAGVDEPSYDTEDGEHPGKVTVTVYRFVLGERCPFSATARWSEYAQYKAEYRNGQPTGNKALTDMWARMPYLMLAKCAESQALRKAFPAELSGLYTHDEMQQADNEPPVVEQAGSDASETHNPTDVRPISAPATARAATRTSTRANANVKAKAGTARNWDTLKIRASYVLGIDGPQGWQEYATAVTGITDRNQYGRAEYDKIKADIDEQEANFEAADERGENGPDATDGEQHSLEGLPVAGVS